MKTFQGRINDIMSKLKFYAYELDKDKEYVIEIKKYKKNRSKDANSYFHVLVNKLARHLDIDETTMKINLNLEYGTLAINEKTGKVAGAKLPKGTNPYEYYEYSKWYGEEDNCDLYLYYKRTHLLNTAEMAKLIDGVVQECHQVGIETLTPAELESLKNSWNS